MKKSGWIWGRDEKVMILAWICFSSLMLLHCFSNLEMASSIIAEMGQWKTEFFFSLKYSQQQLILGNQALSSLKQMTALLIMFSPSLVTRLEPRVIALPEMRYYS